MKYLKKGRKRWVHYAFDVKKGNAKVYKDGELFTGTYEFFTREQPLVLKHEKN